jgi:hypothetical protein
MHDPGGDNHQAWRHEAAVFGLDPNCSAARGDMEKMIKFEMRMRADCPFARA